MAEPWSIVADHPATNEPFGIVIQDDSNILEAEYLAQQLLLTYRILGTFIPTTLKPSTEGHYLIAFTVAPSTIPRLATIWAENLADATLRLQTLKHDGILFMPTSG